MAEAVTSAKSPQRQKRVKRLKRIIVGSAITIILAPSILAVIFGIRLLGLKRELAKTQEELNYYLEAQSEFDFVSNEADSVVFDDSESETETVPDIPAKEYKELSQSDIDNLVLSDAELYEGYRRVYLTFDDGPSSNTDDILDVLNSFDVKGTFFVIKKEGRNFEKLYRRIVDEGHSIGMHSCTHVYSDLYKSTESFMDDTKTLQDYIYMVTGVESNLYRFPGGSSNRVSKTDVKLLASNLHEAGIEYFDWNVSSQDSAGGLHTKSEIVANSIANIKNYDDVIILFHDTNSKVSTVEALPEIIKYIQSLDNTVILPITGGTRPIQHLRVD